MYAGRSIRILCRIYLLPSFQMTFIISGFGCDICFFGAVFAARQTKAIGWPVLGLCLSLPKAIGFVEERMPREPSGRMQSTPTPTV